MCQTRYRTGFTIVELLVVVAIVALLTGILLPALSSARSAAKSGVCLSQLRSTLQSTHAMVGEHRGQAPLSGLFWGYGPDQFVSRRLGRDLLSYDDDGVRRPMPFFASLAQFGGADLPTDSREHLQSTLVPSDEGTLDRPNFKAFRCPADASFTPDDAAVTLTGDVGYDGLREISSYLPNGYVLGAVSDQKYLTPTPRRLRGKLDRVALPSQTVLLFDGEPITFWRFPLQATLPFTPGGSSFSGYFGMLTDWWRGGVEQFDFERHHGRMNIGYVDGHAATSRMETTALAGVFVSNP